MIKFILLALILGALLYGLRIKRLLANTHTLVVTSETFKRDYYVGSATDAPLSYIALGDSVTQGSGCQSLEETYVYQVAQALAAKGRYVHVQNFAKSGAKVSDLLHKQLPLDGKLKPDYITITIGTNDATHFTDPAAYETTVDQIVDELDSYKSTTILLANSINAGNFPALPPIYAQLAGRRAADQNKTLVKILKQKRSAIKTVDLYTTGKLDAKINSAYYASDLFHPAKAGYERWSKLFIEQL